MTTKPDKAGAVLVVGSGIAGIQASLDLAESGYYVHLVEKEPAIGGVMPMLDKTFPTNDCSMCILSPKLVECGRHLNVETHTYAEVADIQGEPGNFKVKIKQRPRYVELDKCTGCGECANACPVEVKSEFNQGLESRKAIYKHYAQAFPNAYVIDKVGTPPCRAACPAGVNAQGYVQLIKLGKFTEAWELIYRDNPFPAACGRVCTHPCQSKCHRATIDEPINIMQLKRVASDYAYNSLDNLPLPQVEEQKEQKIAVIGAGPAGMSCAYQLAKKGYGVTVYEALPVGGGMMRVGIPEYRLPKKWLDIEFGLFEKLGIKIVYNTRLGKDITVQGLMDDGFSAVFVAIGAHKGTLLGIPGEDLGGVIHGVEFLRQNALGEKVKIGKRVAVIGGGNTAMDCARTAVRLGAESVSIVYRRTEAEITALPEEIAEAKEEGIIFTMLTSPKTFIGEDGKLTQVECLQNELGEPDSSGRRRPVAVSGSEYTMDIDTVILAVGQRPDAQAVENTGIGKGRGNTLAADPETLATDMPGVFAGGDAVTGPKTVVEAIAAGKVASDSIVLYLGGNDLKADRQFKVPEEDIVPFRFENESIPTKKPDHISHAEITDRVSSFVEVSNGYTLEQAKKEAERCLNCGVCSECLQCEKACLAHAINHNMQAEEFEIEVGAVLLCPGFEKFDSSELHYYGYGKLPNVVSSLEFERILSASGPFGGHLMRPSDHKEPKKIAWIQCAGSRNCKIGKGYCSSVCCMYAIKEAVIAKEHAPYPLEAAIFYMDMRTYGKDFEKYYERAQNEQGVRFIRSRVYELVDANDGTGNVKIRYTFEDGTIQEEDFDLVVLSIGMNPPQDMVKLAGEVGISLNKYNFAEPLNLTGVGTSKPGVFVAGAFSGPRDIPETVMQASAAASDCGSLLADVRGTLVKTKEYPPQKDVSGEPVRTGVFICHCGINIGGIVNVPEVVEYAKTLPGVAFADDNMYTCSQDTAMLIKQAIHEHNLNRVVVASCSPRTHEPLFQETLKEAGLNPNLFEMANIRDQCSWVHMREPEKATAKAKDLVKMAIYKAALLEPVQAVTLDMNHDVLIIGGGIAGMTAALSMAKQGYKVSLVEKSDKLGGIANRIKYGMNGDDVQAFVADLSSQINANDLISVYTGTEVADIQGFVGNYATKLSTGDEIKHGVAIIATGAQEYKPNEYLYGQNDKVKTLLELEEDLAGGKLAGSNNFVLIQCVGSRDSERPYCSRICCTKSIKQALKIKELNPTANVFILYRDIRTYGFQEDMYTEARRKGVIFVRYSINDKPVVEANGDKLKVTVMDHVLRVPLTIDADVVGLAAAIVPNDNTQLSKFFKVPLNQEGFFLEAHMKLRPVDFSTDGVFMCGLAHGPKNIDENIAQAKAAVGRACTILAKSTITVEGKCAFVNTKKCAGCGECEAVCPAKAVQVDPVEKVAVVNEALCKGCGACSSSCRCGAINVKGCTNQQFVAMLNAL
ncbi:NAD(P)-binding protein [Desulfoscipio sp. XC116]|uniref:NAD(P)-binding protein n=1 Tax=Desulfoscipio sp. XC116 TaxID=3144975 RepID=UPI00325B8681